MPETLQIPRLVGSREAADSMISRLGDLQGDVLLLDCRQLVSGSLSFANQLIVRLFHDKKPDHIEVIDADEEFWGYLIESARAIGMEERVIKGVSGRLVSR